MGLSRIEMERLNAKRFAKEVLALRQQVRDLQHELARFQPADPVTNADSCQPVKVKPSPDEHYDDYCIRQFAKLMSEKMAASRAKGRSGWNDPERCSIEYLRSLLYEHLDKGDPVDVANFCMMLRHYEASTYREFCNCTPQPSPADPVTKAGCCQQVRDLQHELARFQPVAVRHSPEDGGYQFIDSGSGSDWATRHPDGETLYVREGD